MRRIALSSIVFLLASCLAADESPCKGSQREIAAYSKALLTKLFPQDRNLVEKTQVTYWCSKEMNAYFDLTRKGPTIFVASGLLEALDNEGEYAAVLAHEFGHAKIQRQLMFLAPLFSRNTKSYLEGSEGGEFGADAIALEALTRSHYDPSLLLRVLQKAWRSENASEDDPRTAIVAKRIKYLEKKFGS